jgi:hypothetical protein
MNRKCNHCKKKSESDKMVHIGIKAFCDNVCKKAFILSNKHTLKNGLKNTKSTKRLKPKTNTQLIKEVQTVVNRYVRYRDILKGYGCISCNKQYDGNKFGWDAGHYISRRHNKTRFHLDNIHLQCKRCNRYGNGEPIAYRKSLIKRIGEEKVTKLENEYLTLHKFPSEYLERFKKVFSKKYRKLEKMLDEK